MKLKPEDITVEWMRNHPVYKNIEAHPELDDTPLMHLESYVNDPRIVNEIIENEAIFKGVKSIVDFFSWSHTDEDHEYWRQIYLLNL